jgi:uncharacterized phage protein gp47/JayE
MPKAFIRVLAKALAGVYILLYKYGGFMFLQVFPSTATNDQTVVNGTQTQPLTNWGVLKGVGSAKPATKADLVITVSVKTVGGVLPAGSQLINSATGVTYLTLTTVDLSTSSVSATVRASADQSGGDGSGAIGNMQAGSSLFFASPLANIEREAVVSSQSATGVDAETEASYRQRVIDSFQKPPQGGAYSDYELWAEATPGIVAAYPYTSSCPGMVDVYLESDTGVPTAAQLQAALDNINLYIPATAVANTFSVSFQSIDVEVTGLAVPNAAAVQLEIQSALEAYFAAREPFISGLTVPPREDRITESSVAGVVEDVVTASGGIFELVNLSLNGVEFGFYTLGVGEKSELGVLNFA